MTCFNLSEHSYLPCAYTNNVSSLLQQRTSDFYVTLRI